MARGLAAFVVARARWISAISLLLALFCVDYSWNHLRYSKDRTQLLGSGDPVQQRFEAYRREFPGTDLDVLVLVGGSDEPTRLMALGDFARGLASDSAHFSETLYRVDASVWESASLYALSATELGKIETDMRAGLPLLRARALGGMVGLLRHLNALPIEELRAMQPQLAGVLGRLRDCFARRSLPPRASARKSPFRDGWLNLSLGTEANFLIVRLRPENAGEGLRILQTRVEAARQGGLTFDLVGDYAIKAEDGRVSLNSALLCSLISLVLIKLLFLFTSAVRRRPQLALLALLCGLCWSLAWATWSIGELNLVSVNFAATLVGLGMDFAIHLLFRYEEFEGGTAWGISFATAGRENALGALATAAAFLSLCGTPFRGVAQLGWISGCGIFFVWVAMTVLFPALISMWGGVAQQASYRRLSWLLTLEESWLSSSRAVVLGAVVFTLAMAAGIPRLGFDSNLLHMSWNDSLARRSEAAFRRYCGTSCLFLVSSCTGEELTERVRAFGEQPGRVESLASLYQMSHPSQEQRATVGRILELAAEFPPPTPVRRYTAEELLALKKILPAELAHLEARIPAGELQRVLAEIRTEARDIGPGAVQDALESFEESYTGDVRERLAQLQGQKVEIPSMDLLPAMLLQRYRGVSGRWLVKFYPRADIWDEGQLRETVEAVIRVDAELTGQPILSQRYLELLNSGYRQASWIALSVIVILLLVYFRSLEKAFLVLLPKLLGLTWMLGILGWSGLALNPANATALPLTLGVGLVFGVHVLHGALEGKPVFSGSTGAAVAVSAASTILGYAALTLSWHKGIASLGWVMMIGVGANLVAAVVVLPCFMRERSGRTLP